MKDVGRFLGPEDPLVAGLAESGERMLPPLDVLDWWEHPGEEGRTAPTGLVGVPRKLVVTTERILVIRDGLIERTVAVRSIGGAERRDPSQWPWLEEADRAVFVHSHDDPPVVWGCWSLTTAEADQLMSDIFQLAHDLPLSDPDM